MSRRQPFQMGDVDTIITEEALRQAYGVEVKIICTQEGEERLKTCVPLLEQCSLRERREAPWSVSA